MAVDRWSVESPGGVHDDTAAYEDPSPVGDWARAAAERHKSVRLSPALRCAAVETARFLDEKGALPTESLQRFVAARCGSSSPSTRPTTLHGTGLAALSDAAVLDRMKPGIEKLVDQALEGDAPRLLGIAVHRSADRGVATVAAVVGSDPASLEPLSHSVDASRHVVIRGTVRGSAASAIAYVNQGETGVVRCPADPATRLPSFAFVCTLADGDRYAWAEVVARRPGHVLDEMMADILVDDGDTNALEYHGRAIGPTAAPPQRDGFDRALLAAVNAVRARGNLAALTLAAKQSATNARLAGNLVAASTTGQGDDVDRIALGMLAGWDIAGTIRDGQMFVGLLSPAHDVTDWLDFALERPIGRVTLLAPDARTIAIAPAMPGTSDALGAVVTTYALFDSPDHGADAARMFARVQAERRRGGRPELARYERVDTLETQAGLVLAGKEEPGKAIEAAITTVASDTGKMVNGFVVEANDLASAPCPIR